MTRDEAYAAGFCKVAEAAGVDPVALYKQAAGWDRAVAWGSRLWSRGGDIARRYGELMSGARYDRLDARVNRVMSQLHPDMTAMPWLRSRLKAINKLRAREQALSGDGFLTGRFHRLTARAADIEQRMARMAPPDKATAQWYLSRLAPLQRQRSNEFYKVMGARLGTLGVGGGGLYAGMNARRGSQETQPQADAGGTAGVTRADQPV